MHRVAVAKGAALLALALAAPASAQPVGTRTATQPAGNAREAARAALRSFDLARLVRDRAYAEEILRHLDTLDADAAERPYAMDRFGMRLLAFAALARRDEAEAGIDRLVRAGPTEVQPHVDALWSALILEDTARAVAVLDGASRHVGAADRAALGGQIGPSVPRAMFARLTGDAARPARARLAGALLRIGWPGEADRVAGDDLRMMLLNDRIERGDANGAAEIAAAITTPAVIVQLIVLRRYDSVIGADRDRLAMLRNALAEEDRETARAVAVREPGIEPILARVRYLRAVGRNSEAWTLAEPLTRDVAATVALGDSGMWLISQAARALFALGRKDEAVALDGRLVAVPLSVNSLLINVDINHIGFLAQAGRYGDSLDYARSLERDRAGAANAYGRMWISAGIVCALARLGRADEAAPVLAAMRATSEDNPGAMTRVALCLDDLAAAEALLVRRLGSSEAESLALDFQEFELDREPPAPGSLDAGLRAMRERPAVRAALDRVARTMRLPLAALTWN